MFGFGPKFDKDLQKGSVSLDKFSKSAANLTKSIEATDKGIDEYNQKIKESKKTMAGMSKQQILQSNIVQETNSLEGDRQELLKQKSEQKEQKSGLDKQQTAVFEDIRKNILKISDAEMEKRAKETEKIRIAQQGLDQLKKSDTNGLMGVEIAEKQKNVDLMKEKEQVRQQKQQTNVFKKGFKGLGNGLKNLGENLKGKAGFALKTGLIIAAYFALAKFLQSEKFKELIKFIKEKVLPNLKEIVITIGILGGIIIAAKIVGLISAISTAFGILKAAFLATKIGLAIASTPLLVVVAIVAAIGIVIAGIFQGFKDFQTTLEETGSITEALKAGVAKFLAFVVGFIPDMILKLVAWVAGLFGFDDVKEKLNKFSFVDFITEKLILVMTGIQNFFSDMFTKISTIFKAVGKAGKAAIKAFAPGGESPTEAFGRVFNETMEGEETAERRASAASALGGAGYDLGKKVTKTPDSLVTDKPSNSIQNNTTVVNRTNVNNGGNTQTSLVSKTVKDQSSEYAMGM